MVSIEYNRIFEDYFIYVHLHQGNSAIASSPVKQPENRHMHRNDTVEFYNTNHYKSQ